MIGAILGDMIGAPYEFDMGKKTKDFPLFGQRSEFTDDSVMTVAVADALMDTIGQTDEEIRAALTASMQMWGRRYPDAGYGTMFYRWLREAKPEPYGSYGNGSAMRVSSAGWLYDTLEETRHIARLTAEVTHNHPEGIKGAEATATAIFLARTGSGKEDIRNYIVQEFGYDLSRTCDEIRPGYHHVESCQKTVPEAITAFLEGNGFEDVIRTAVSLGGDCDTLTCIAGGIAEALYGVPPEMDKECRRRLPEDMIEVLERFQKLRNRKLLENGSLLRTAIRICNKNRTPENLIRLSGILRDSRIWIPCTAVVSAADNESMMKLIEEAEANGGLDTLKGQELTCHDSIRMIPDILQNGDNYFFPVFTSEEEMGEYGDSFSKVQKHFLEAVHLAEKNEKDVSGIVINAFTEPLVVPKEIFDIIADMPSMIETEN